MAEQGIEAHSTFHLERDMEHYTSMGDDELIFQAEAAEFLLEHSLIRRQVQLARRVLAHIDFEVSQRTGDGFRDTQSMASSTAN